MIKSVDYIKHGDCRDLLQEIPTESIDLLITDCPYKLISGGCTGMHGMLSGKENPEIKSGGYFYIMILSFPSGCQKSTEF